MRTSLVVSLALVFAVLMGQEAAAQKKADVRALIKQLQSPFSREVIDAAQALGELGPKANSAVKPLAEALLKSRFTDETRTIALALKKIGPASKAAVPALTQKLKR